MSILTVKKETMDSLVNKMIICAETEEEKALAESLKVLLLVEAKPIKYKWCYELSVINSNNASIQWNAEDIITAFDSGEHDELSKEELVRLKITDFRGDITEDFCQRVAEQVDWDKIKEKSSEIGREEIEEAIYEEIQRRTYNL